MSVINSLTPNRSNVNLNLTRLKITTFVFAVMNIFKFYCIPRRRRACRLYAIIFFFQVFKILLFLESRIISLSTWLKNRLQTCTIQQWYSTFFCQVSFLCHSKGSKCQLNIFEASYIE